MGQNLYIIFKLKITIMALDSVTQNRYYYAVTDAEVEDVIINHKQAESYLEDD